jgi:hypothetical protein
MFFFEKMVLYELFRTKKVLIFKKNALYFLKHINVVILLLLLIQRKMKQTFLICLLFSFPFFAKAQVGLYAGKTLLLVPSLTFQPLPKIENTFDTKEEKTLQNLQPTWSFSESNVYDNHFGFFCKVEVKLDKVAKVPMRFRLGSIDYVNGLEGK